MNIHIDNSKATIIIVSVCVSNYHRVRHPFLTNLTAMKINIPLCLFTLVLLTPFLAIPILDKLDQDKSSNKTTLNVTEPWKK